MPKLRSKSGEEGKRGEAPLQRMPILSDKDYRSVVAATPLGIAWLVPDMGLSRGAGSPRLDGPFPRTHLVISVLRSFYAPNNVGHAGQVRPPRARHTHASSSMTEHSAGFFGACGRDEGIGSVVEPIFRSSFPLGKRFEGNDSAGDALFAGITAWAAGRVMLDWSRSICVRSSRLWNATSPFTLQKSAPPAPLI